MSYDGFPKPKSLLGYYRLLSPTASVRVSPLCLGAMGFGEAWQGWMGECSKSTAFRILDRYYDGGGNFVDTSNNYQFEESETWIGEWMALRQNRHEMVISTKFSIAYPMGKAKILANFGGNSAKSLQVSIEDSLRKLQTNYVDILYVHFWDGTASIQELMQALHRQVSQGKVLYLGASNTPAWVVSRANEYARCMGLTQFSVYQGHWSASFRDLERDIVPMCESEGMGVVPWGVLEGGKLRSESESAEAGAKAEGRKGPPPTDQIRRVAEVLGIVAERKQAKVAGIALAYLLHKSPYVSPLVGCRTVEQLEANVEALAVELDEADLEEIDAAADFDVGYPLSQLFEFDGKQKHNSRMSWQDNAFIKYSGWFDGVRKTQPPLPRRQ